LSPSNHPPTESTDLAGGQINGSGDTITVQLIRPADIPAGERTLRQNRAIIRIAWPPAPTVCTPGNYPAVAAAITRIIAESATALARIKAHGR
jgi:hypothetical protein